MARHFLYPLLLLSLTTSVAACGGEKAPPAAEKAEPAGPAEVAEAAAEGGKDDAKAGAEAAAAPAVDLSKVDAAKVERASKAAELANAIQKDPAGAEKLLADAGSDRAAFEAELYEIAGDAELSAVYTSKLDNVEAAPAG